MMATMTAMVFAPMAISLLVVVGMDGISGAGKNNRER